MNLNDYPKTKRALKWIACIIITLWIYFTYYNIRENSISKRIIAQTNALLDLKTEEATHWKDEAGAEHLRAEKLFVDKLVFQNHNIELARQLDLKPKQIEGKTVIITELKYVNKFDTLYKDNYLYIEKDGDSIYLSATDTLIMTEYWKRKWLLGQKHYYVDISNKSPHVKLTGLSSIEVKKKEKKITIGLSFGWDLIHKQPFAGISITPSFLTIKL